MGGRVIAYHRMFIIPYSIARKEKPISNIGLVVNDGVGLLGR